MPPDTLDLADLSPGDRILFNDKKQPLTVTSVDGDKVAIEGPKGGSYVLFQDDDTILVSTSGNRRYASPVSGLRVVGEWKQVSELRWEHSRSGATIAVEENEIGKWTVRTDGVPLDEPVGYGYTKQKYAREHALNIIRDHPEG